jgi:hypothetical protein
VSIAPRRVVLGIGLLWLLAQCEPRAPDETGKTRQPDDVSAASGSDKLPTFESDHDALPTFNSASDTHTLAGSQPTLDSSTPDAPNDAGCAAVTSMARPREVEVVTDGETSAALEQQSASSWCVRGRASSAGDDGAWWGAGLRVILTSRGVGGPNTPFDASAQGIVGVRFQLSASGRPVQVWLTEVNAPNIGWEANNFEQNPFVWGGTDATELTRFDTYEVAFDAFTLPAKTFVPFEFMRALDPTRLHTLQFVVANERNGPSSDYTFCISQVEWLNACGASVELTTLAEPNLDEADASLGMADALDASP